MQLLTSVVEVEHGRPRCVPCSQGGCTLAAEVIFAARADGTPQSQCPVTVTDRGNGTHEFSFVSASVRSSRSCEQRQNNSRECRTESLRWAACLEA